VFTTTADGGNSPTERMRIDSAGNVGIGTTAPFDTLDVKPSANRHIVITSDASYANNGIAAYNDSGSEIALGIAGSPLQFFTQAAERAQIDSSGRLLVGTSSVISNNFGGTAGLLQVAKNDYVPIGFFAYSNIGGETGYCPYVELNRARGTQATPTTVANGDDLGLVNFYGHDGSTFIRAATIKSVVDGTPGANDMPGRLVFSTTADGASSPTERIRIDSHGTTLNLSVQLNLITSNLLAAVIKLALLPKKCRPSIPTPLASDKMKCLLLQPGAKQKQGW
jgi:hypothetical protein